MSTRSSARNLFPPLDNPKLTIRRRYRVDPTLLNDFKMATDENGDPPVPDLQTMKELCQPSLNGRVGPIAPIAIQATNFGLKNDMIQQVKNSCQFHGLSGDDANKHLDKFLHVTQSIKVNGVTDDTLRLYLYPHSLTHHAIAWFDCLRRNSINTFEQMAKMFLGKYFSPSMVTKLRNEITYFCQPTVGQTQNVYAAGAYQGGNSYQLQGNRNLLSYRSDNYLGPPGFNQNQNRNNQNQNFQNQNMNQGNNHGIPQGNNQGRNQFFQGASHGKRCHMKNMKTKMTSLTNSNLELKNMFDLSMKMNTTSSLGSETLPSNTVTNPKKDLKGITTRSGTAYQGPTIPTTSSSLPQVVERKTEVTKDTMPPTNNGSTKNVQPPVVQIETLVLNSEPVVSPVSALKPNQKPSIPYPYRFHDQKLRDKANDQKDKFFQIFKDINFNISFADALILVPKFGPTIKTLADLGASINLMPLSVWNKISLPELTPTLMTLELADRSISRPISVAEYVFVKVGKFHFWADFVVVDFDADPRVPLILGRSFLKTRRALIDVYARELTLRVNNEAVTFSLDQTLRYSANYNDMTANQIDVIDMACEEYSQEVLGFFDVITSGNPTPYYELIVSTSSLTLTPIGDSDFFLEEVDAFLALEDDPTSQEVDHSYYDTEGDILLFEAFLNDDPSLPPPNQGMHLPQVRKELKISEAKNDKSLIDEPPKVELKDLPPHLEYTFSEGDDKLPIIIAKDLGVEEKAALIKILMEDDFESAVHHQRRVNPKFHDVIKKEVLKLLDARLIYPISDSPWVIPVHCVPKNGGFTIVKNEENELIPTRLVTRLRVCIDYRRLNEATHKDHFPLPFMDQMLDRLAGNEYYCFLHGYSRVTFKFPSILKINKRTHSRILMECLPTVTCLLGYAMHRARSKGV
nr:reverse transcriptase domain-containing protein [Tanacetum cinerariifolium]